MLGFVNGLAIVIFLAQMTQFKVAGADGVKVWMTGWPLVNDARPCRRSPWRSSG